MKKEESDIIDLTLDCYKREGYGTGEYCHETSFVWGYQEGYEQAEKDLALTWEDMLRIDEITNDVYRDSDTCNTDSIYQEVLRRFNEEKATV